MLVYIGVIIMSDFEISMYLLCGSICIPVVVSMIVALPTMIKEIKKMKELRDDSE